jgi:hypothetical protein
LRKSQGKEKQSRGGQGHGGADGRAFGAVVKAAPEAWLDGCALRRELSPSLPMNYPLNFRFKLLALAPQIFVEDSGKQTVCYVKQKLFKLKEKVSVFRNDAMNDLVATIEADRIIDWSAKYTFTD